ncbi:sensor histidine kinase [Elizabethkingia argentiflava]|uniref:histidine kinase n=1 Tax=Elizabethkingia argenteiflava TaxID=2681556 RepID=A0A845PTG0_9FLAO|nr:HAMP domain-containing sensor histidine kinase [Elizabethkingia argenteiflava]NAW51522.1 sensor histidine kinase [Elizabethkingia argenteiflava]
MKPLLNKTTRPFILYVMMVLIISIPVYYFVMDSIWKRELDEHNKLLAEKTAYEFNQLDISIKKLEESIALWNHIQPGTNITKTRKGEDLSAKTFTIEKPKIYSQNPNIDRFRCLSTVIYIKNKPYWFTIETNIEESQETIAILAITTIFFFIMIVLGFLHLNKKLSGRVWEPFRDSLEKLKKFNLNHHHQINFIQTDTMEFEELNESLRKLIDHSVSVFNGQKEFTENASHELQTPLAIIKNKLNILLQSKNLTDEHYEIVEEINVALMRSSRINKNLLLLANIKNSQFDIVDLYIGEQVHKSINHLEEHIAQKNMAFSYNIQNNIRCKGNICLTEVLINNLLINALKYTHSSGEMMVELTHHDLRIKNSGFEGLNPHLIFKRFSRFSSDKGGSGLGLAIIKEICRFQDWKIIYIFENNFHIFKVKF